MSGDVFFVMILGLFKWSRKISSSWALKLRIAIKLLLCSVWPLMAMFCLPHKIKTSIIFSSTCLFCIICSLCVLETNSITEFFVFSQNMLRNDSAEIWHRWCDESLLSCLLAYDVKFTQSDTGLMKVLSLLSFAPNYTQNTIHSIFTYRVPHPRTLFKPGMIELSWPIIYVSKIIKKKCTKTNLNIIMEWVQSNENLILWSAHIRSLQERSYMCRLIEWE